MSASAADADIRDTSPANEHARESPSPHGSSRGPSAGRPSTSQDRESRERPVRKKFEETKIDEDGIKVAESEVVAVDGASGTEVIEKETTVYTDTNGERGRVRRKRSFEEHREEAVDAIGDDARLKHQRKRTRDFKAENDDNEDMGDVAADDESIDLEARPSTPQGEEVPSEDIRPSPQNEQTNEQSLESQNGSKSIDSQELDSKVVSAVDTDTPTTNDPSSTKVSKLESPENHEPREDVGGGEASPSKDATKEKSLPSIGFGNTSAQSPFGALSSPKKTTDLPQTSASAFRASGFASMADSSQSPFGALQGAPKINASTDGSSGGGFLSFASSTKSPFASVGGSSFGQSSGFGTLGSGFGSSGSAFGSSIGPPLKSFASGKPGGLAQSSKPVKPIGTTSAEGEEDEASGEETAEVEGGIGLDDELQKDDRFYQRELKTGEEGEIQMFSAQAKLFINENGVWKERGQGDFKVNARIVEAEGEDEEDVFKTKTTGRMLMRTRGAHKLVLNSPILDHVEILDSQENGPPKGRHARFSGFAEGKSCQFLLKVNNNAIALDLRRAVEDIKAEGSK